MLPRGDTLIHNTIDSDNDSDNEHNYNTYSINDINNNVNNDKGNNPFRFRIRKKDCQALSGGDVSHTLSSILVGALSVKRPLEIRFKRKTVWLD